MAPPTEADTIRILIASDNHVGFEERDSIRKDDSWKTFDEILNLARTEDVDMVLLGGDLFHDNKPSRKSMYQVMRALRKNCFGMKPCELQFLSDASEIFEGAFGHVNYEDPDINISIPVFSIHGNHDDPSGDGHFCSLDLLQAAGLLNYFGRVPEVDNIEVKPVLLQKGRTKLALFGLSNVRDERMFRTFRDHKVKFYRPNQAQTDFFNLLTVHQNHHAHTATSYLPENVLPDWMDLVVWGHEHECLIDPRENPETGFHVMQPGSSVATSLIPGEAVTKHVAILSVTGKEFKVDKLALKSVRPLVTQDLVLATDKRFKNLSKQPDNRMAITRKLEEIINDMIEQANDEWLGVQDEDDDDREVPLPLIRLRVEFTAPEGEKFDCENPQRFSNRFVGKVANVNDVVHFYRKKKGATKRDTDKKAADAGDEAASNLDEIKVEALVEEYLAAQSLSILPQGEFGDAVNQFVNKDDKNAMSAFVSESLANQLKELVALECPEDEIPDAMGQLRDKREQEFQASLLKSRNRRRFRPKPDDWDSDMDGSWHDQLEAALAAAASVPSQRAPAARGRARNPFPNDDDDDMFMDDAPEPVQAAPARAPAKRAAAARMTKAAPAKKTAPPKKAPPKGRGRKKKPFEDSDSPEEEEDEDVFMDEEDEPPAPPPPAARKRAAPAKAAPAARTAGRGKQTTLNFSQSQRPTRGTQKAALEISDDEISEGDDPFESLPATRSRRK